MSIVKVIQQMRQYCPNEDAEHECRVSGNTLLYWARILEEYVPESEAQTDLRDLHDNKEIRDSGYVKCVKESTGKCDSCSKACNGVRGWEYRLQSGTVIVRHCRDCAINAINNETYPFGI
jgi:hypothetical protein